MNEFAVSRFPSRLVAAMLFVMLALAGCSTFKGERRIDMGPFAENTTSLVSEVQFGPMQKQINYIQPYMKGPAVARLRAEWQDTQRYLRGVVLYSTQVVAINNSLLPDEGKNRLLGETLDSSFRSVLDLSPASQPMSSGRMDSIIASVKSSPKFLDALNAAQPILEEVERACNIEFNKYKELEIDATAEIGSKIDSTFADLLANLRSIEYMQMQSLGQYRLLYDYKRGRTGALDTLLREVPALRQLAGGTQLSAKETDTIESHLVAELAQIKDMRDQIGPEIEWYVATKRELDERRLAVDELLKKCRLAVMQWARANSNLAAGVQVPPLIDIIGITKGAAGRVSPL